MSIFNFGKSSERAREASAKTRAWEAYAQMAETRSFSAAVVDRLVADWKYDGGFTNNEVLSALPSMRSRSRDMAKNSPLYARFIRLMRENIVGDGFRFKALPAATMDDPEKIDGDAAKMIEYHWWKWSRNPYYVDSGRRQDLTQFLALVVENWARDGEAFVLIDDASQNKYGVSLRLLRADAIDETMNFMTKDGNFVRGGVETNMDGAPIAYYFDGNRSDGANVYTINGKSRVRIPARSIIHLYERHDADQVRGLPLGFAALLPLKMLDEYTKAELTAARDEACTIGAFSCPAGQEGPAQMTPDVANGYREKLSAGQKLFLPDGWTYNSTTPQHPNRGWSDFSVGLQRMISTGLGVDFAELTGNGSDTISAVARQSMLRTREMYKDRQRTVATVVLNRIYYAWLHSILGLKVSGTYTALDFERFEDHTFQGRRWGWIDPNAEVNAATVATAHGWRTDAEIAAEYGNDIDDNIAEQLRVKDAKAEAGLITIGNGLQVQAKESTDKNDADTTDAKEDSEIDESAIDKKTAKED